MKLSVLLEQVQYELIQGSLDTEVAGIENDSRRVHSGSLFFCIKGAVSDGHAYAQMAAEKGASVLVVQDDVDVPADVTVVRTPDSRLAMAQIAAAWYGHPARTLKVIGVTGTKGKTTTTYMIKSILENAGYKVGLIGTIESIIGDEVIPSENTTPESVIVQSYFRRMLDKGCQVAVMEVSSQALMLHRTAGFEFETGIFTNLEPDHIGPNEHASFEEYLECKSRLFRQCRHGIFNADDPHLAKILEGHTCTVETYGFSEGADLQAVNEHLVSGPGYLGVAYHVNVHGKPEQEEDKEGFDVEIDIPGRFSVYNSLCAIAVCRHFGVPHQAMMDALKCAKVKGRIEKIPVSDQFTLMIDYAHNAMALESLLSTLREYKPHRLVCLFGCGGNRSKLRRYEMGEVSGRLADFTIITSDNPRYEEPEAIIDDIVSAIEKTDGTYVRITDRKEAIRYAIRNAQPGDIVILAGKGHEDYQEICGKKYPMDERVLIKEILEEEKSGSRS